jgi:hypothetical protein
MRLQGMPQLAEETAAECHLHRQGRSAMKAAALRSERNTFAAQMEAEAMDGERPQPKRRAALGRRVTPGGIWRPQQTADPLVGPRWLLASVAAVALAASQCCGAWSGNERLVGLIGAEIRGTGRGWFIAVVIALSPPPFESRA